MTASPNLVAGHYPCIFQVLRARYAPVATTYGPGKLRPGEGPKSHGHGRYAGPMMTSTSKSPRLDVRVDAVLCDMDGTIVDSNAMVEQMWSAFASEQDLNAREVIAFAHGVPSIDTLRRFVGEPAQVEAWFARISRWEHEHFFEVAEIAGAGEFLRRLPGSAWAVVTSALHAAAAARLEAVGLPVAPVLIGADDVHRGKPDPEGFVAAARVLGVDPARCIVFEDTVAGITAARAAGTLAAVMGTVEHPVMEGIPRLSNWRGVSAAVEADGRLHLWSNED